jgi:hypothetical protein
MAALLASTRLLIPVDSKSTELHFSILTLKPGGGRKKESKGWKHSKNLVY